MMISDVRIVEKTTSNSNLLFNFKSIYLSLKKNAIFGFGHVFGTTNNILFSNSVATILQTNTNHLKECAFCKECSSHARVKNYRQN